MNTPFRWVQNEISRRKLLRHSVQRISLEVGEEVEDVEAVLRHQRNCVRSKDGAEHPFYGEVNRGPDETVRCATCGCSQSVYIPGHQCRSCDRIQEMKFIPA